MKSLDLFLPWVLPYVYGCTDGLAKQMLLDACIEFCGDSLVAQTVEAQDVVAGVAEYDISAPSQQELSKVIKVFYEQQELSAVALDEVRHGAAARAAVDSTVEPFRGRPTAYHQTTPTDSALYLWPVPDKTVSGALAIRAAFQPTRSATQVEDVLFDSYVLQISYGALARLLRIPGQPFTNPVFAKDYDARFSAAIKAAANQALRGDLRANLRVRPVAFA